MKESRTKNAVRNIIFGIVNKIVVLLFPFIIRTVMINKLGSEYLGLSSLFTSLLQVLNLAELGFSSAVVYSMYKPLADKNTKKICALMNLYKKTYRIIGIIITIIGLLLIPFIRNLINGDCPVNINIYVLYILYLGNTSLTYFLFAYKSAILTADQRNDIITNIQTITYILQYVTQIIILIIMKNYYLFVSAQIITTIINNISIYIITNKKYPEYKCYGEIEKNEKKDIKKRVVGLMIQKVCGTTRNSLDSIFISAFLGLNMVAMYNNYYTIISAITGVLTIITSSIIAGVGNSIATESIQKNYKDMSKFNFLYMWLSGWCTICLLCLFQSFMTIWMGNEYILSMGAVICFCIYFYALKIGDVLSGYTQAAGIWWEGKFKAILETVVNIVLNFVLGKYFGVYGIILATTISLLTVGLIYGTRIVFNNYFKGINIKEYYLRHFLYFFVTLIIAIITYFVTRLIKENNIISLIEKFVMCLIIPNILYIIFYFKMDIFKESLQFVKNIVKKGKK